MKIGVLPGGAVPPTASARRTFHAVKEHRFTGPKKEARDVALDPPFVVRVEKQPGGSSFGETMNNIRSWLDHRKIQPASFNSVFNARSDVGFEIGFNSEDEAHVFEEGFRA